jgi:putative ABC transport system permease protein
VKSSTPVEAHLALRYSFLRRACKVGRNSSAISAIEKSPIARIRRHPGMNHLTIGFAYLKDRAPEALLHALLLALGIGTVVFVLLFDAQFAQRMTSDAGHFDLVVGAKGSALQLVLSTVYQADIPTGNIPLSEAQALRADPEVEAAVPMALGDSYEGFRIVGTEPEYASEYRAKLSDGRFWAAPLEAVLGAAVARKSRLHVGDGFVGIHGVFGGGDEHRDTPYRVVGVLGETGTLVDRLVLTSVESVWRVHEAQYAHAKSMILGSGPRAGPDAGGEGNGASGETGTAPGTPREVTALLLRLKSPDSIGRIEQYIDRRPTLQWASPRREATRFLSFIGIGSETMRVMGGVLIVMAALGNCAALFNAMRRRRYDLAIMRTLGASPARLMAFVLVEAAILALAGALVGVLIGCGAVELIGRIVPNARAMALDGAALPWAVADVPLLALGACLIGAALPAILSFRIDVAHVLERRRA